MYTLKVLAQRGIVLGAATALLAATIAPAATVLANNELNPLTERSLLLSSSAPGYTDTDGSGNSEGRLNANSTHYAPPGSGPNGKKTGQTFSFKVSSTSTAPDTLKGFSLQYCTSAAGNCQAPGDNDGDAKSGATLAREDNATAHPKGKSDLDVVGAFTEGVGAGTFQVLVDGAPTTGWTMGVKNAEDAAHTGRLTGKNNLIYLSNATGVETSSYDKVEIIFRASSSNYITNPGSGHFFVKINSYDTVAGADAANFMPTTDANIIDGGVTVANVMTESIHITTKVLETMSFSVGVHNRDTENLPGAPEGEDHGPCDVIEKHPVGHPLAGTNQLQLGDPDAEYSLETKRAWTVDSFWRLSSNSSGGASVYYSGDTLRNTVGDRIRPIQRADNNTGAPVATLSLPGAEQFGLAFVDPSATSTGFQAHIANSNMPHKTPAPAPLVPVAAYNAGADGNAGDGTANAVTAQFAFDDRSLTTPALIAQNNDQVVSCATAKMRYVGNIGADTPAGVYTTKVNYLAAPQY